MTKKSKSKGKSNSSIKDFFSNLPWKWIVVGLIVLFGILAIFKFVSTLGHVEDSLVNLFGSASYGIGDFFTSCTPQADCTKITLCDTCKITGGCGCGTNNTCIITSGRPVQGINWFFCIILGGFIVAFFLNIIVLFSKLTWKSSPNVKDIASSTNQDPNKVSEDLAKQTDTDAKIELKDVKDPSPELKKAIYDRIGSVNMINYSYKQIEKVPAEDKEAYLNNAKNVFDGIDRITQENVNKLSEEERLEYQDATKNLQVEPRPEI